MFFLVCPNFLSSEINLPCIFTTDQLGSALHSFSQLGSAWLSLAQLGSARLSSAQLGSAWLSLFKLSLLSLSAQPGLTWLSTALGSILALKFKRSPFCSNTFEFFQYRHHENLHNTCISKKVSLLQNGNFS